MLTHTLLPAPGGPLFGLEAAPPEGGEYYCSAVLIAGDEPKEVFIPLMRLLARGGHRVLTVDHRGGRVPAGVGAGADTDDLAEVARDLEVALTAAAARHPVHLVGYGFGAGLAARVVLNAPEKCHTFTVIGVLDAELMSAVVMSGVPTLELEGADGSESCLVSPETVAQGILSLWQTH